ncbi:uncharacterized protein LOC120848193 [Ixodes scapularis]|uniref:uncharacterized protein LOC120848193 n=1 Tax=Ixodes scapularis TaxID=6945 RepID=UPI001A9CB958|nr:uncharacterized protein LOC120848193 [Ixodes scapularis]
MSGTPKRRKLYLEPFFDGADLPRSTEHRSLCAERSNTQTKPDDSGVSTVPAGNGPPGPGNSSLSNSDLDEGDECEESGTQVADEQVCEGSANEQDCEGSGSRGAPPDSEFSAQDLVTLVMDFAVTSGMSWTLVEKLMKFVGFIQKRDDLPDTKFLFKKFAGISLESSTFHFYCPHSMLLLGESAGDLTERKQVEATCAQCGQKYTGEERTREGHFFVSLPLERQLTSMLASEEVARSLKSSLQKLSDRCDPTAMGDITDGAFYRKQREELNLKKMDVTMTVNSDGSPPAGGTC